MATFRHYAYLLSPPWLQRYYGERLVGLLAGLTGDLMAEGTAQALRASWLRSSSSPPDALPSLGVERLMPRYTVDTDATYRARLAEAWATWTNGSELRLERQFAAAGLAAVVVPTSTYVRTAWEFEHPPYIRISPVNCTFNDNDGSGNSAITTADSGVDFLASGFYDGGKVWIDGSTLNDGYYPILTVTSATTIRLSGIVLADEGPVAVTLDGTRWSRIAVIIEQPHPYVEWTYGSGPAYGDGHTYGSTVTTTDLANWQALIRRFKAGHEINPYIYLVMAHEYYGDPDLVYGAAGHTYSATAKVIRWPHQV